MIKKMSNFWKQFSKSKIAVLGLAIVIAFIFMAIAAPFITPYDPKRTFIAPPLSPPNSKHWLGTDDVGRDILSLIIYGSRVSLLVGLLASAVGTLLGTIIGLFSGYFGGILDELLMRITDIFLIVPFLPLAIMIMYIFGPSIWNVVLLFGFLGWPTAARQIRSQILSLKEAPFIEAARAIGAGDMHIIFKHLFPCIIGVVIANVIGRTSFAIMAEAGLAFLGASDPTVISWGLMMAYAQSSGAVLLGAWWTIVPPGFCITLLSCGFSFLGYGINLVLNPRLRRH
ncbi:MAG: ABC transporter permease [Candidatus Bathyarchaeia archaeon]